MKSIYYKKLVSDTIYEIIESDYDWSYYFEKNYNVRLNVNPLPNKEITTINSLIMPECSDVGFTVSTLDDLDLVVLKILQTVKTINELIEELKHYFDEDDLNYSKAEFELLIFKKIKKGIHNKSIRVLL